MNTVSRLDIAYLFAIISDYFLCKVSSGNDEEIGTFLIISGSEVKPSYFNLSKHDIFRGSYPVPLKCLNKTPNKSY